MFARQNNASLFKNDVSGKENKSDNIAIFLMLH